jgi:hypothetical protein
MVITILLIHLFSSNLQLFSSKRGIRLPRTENKWHVQARCLPLLDVVPTEC